MTALAASSITKLIAASLPTQASPQLKTPTDALAAAVHAGLLAVNFKLVALGEDNNLPKPSTSEAPLPFPAEWNAHPAIDLKYTHPQSSMQFLLHISRLASKVSIQAIALGHDKVVSFDVTANEYISESSLPASPTKDVASPDDANHAIQGIFISPSRLTDFGNLLKTRIIQPLIPGLQKEGYEDTSTSSTNTSNQQDPPHPRDPIHDPPPYDPLRHDPPPAQPHPPTDPSAPRPSRPAPAGDFPPPGFEDPYDVHRPPRNLPPGAVNPTAGYGERDLYPPGMGPNDPLRVGGPRGGGGGMYMDMRRDLDPNARPDFGPQAPPGARYDPVGPGAGDGVPYDPLSGDMGGPRRGGPGAGGFGGMRGPGGGGGRFGGMGGRPPNPFGGFEDGDFI
ncbi:MAG: hypothetical protein Q9162_005792 [Coniocarpon cinnabarinum]